uniref:Alternative protein n=1 Tax=Mesocestoides corti TaxID=53468 RepID=A0A5K3F781_MESCO
MLATPLNKYCSSFVSISGWLLLPRMPLELRETQDWLRLGGPTCLRPDPTPQ